MFRLLVLVLFFSGFPNAESYNFLVVSPVFGYSHMNFMIKVADTLADGGHNVTLLQTYVYEHWGTIRNTKNKNIEIIDYHNPEHAPNSEMSAGAFKFIWDSQVVDNPITGAIVSTMILFETLKPMCDKLLRDKKLHDWILSKKFDGYVAEAFDCCGLYLGDHLKLNLLPMFSAVKHIPASIVIGEPSMLNYLPSLNSNFGPEQGVWDRVTDLISFKSFTFAFSTLFDRQYNQAYSILDGDVRNWRQILQTSTFFFTNNNPYIGFPTPKLEKMVDIGGLTVDSKKRKVAVNEEYDTIFSLRNTTALISFGTIMRSCDMPDAFKDGIIEMFKNFPETTFIWKYEVEDEKLERRLSENVILKKWVPQLALFGDDRLDLFIGHGGLGSSLEIAYAGKPSLMIPVFGDHYLNSIMLSRHRGSKTYSKFDLHNSEKLTDAVKEVLSNGEYKKNAVFLAEMLQNQPISPQENLLKHAEFAVKFGRVHSLEVYNVNQGFIQYYMLDAYLIIILSVLTALYVSSLVFKLIFRRCCESKSKLE